MKESFMQKCLVHWFVLRCSNPVLFISENTKGDIRKYLTLNAWTNKIYIWISTAIQVELLEVTTAIHWYFPVAHFQLYFNVFWHDHVIHENQWCLPKYTFSIGCWIIAKNKVCDQQVYDSYILFNKDNLYKWTTFTNFEV